MRTHQENVAQANELIREFDELPSDKFNTEWAINWLCRAVYFLLCRSKGE